MRVLAEVREQDIIPLAPLVDTQAFDRREAVRAVVLNDLRQVALLRVAARQFHKLPGGGIEPGESKHIALAREVLEEIGCTIKISAELGAVIEYRDTWHQIQTSYCYLARQIGQHGETALTHKEQADGCIPLWARDINEAIALCAGDRPSSYDGKRIQYRDLLLLRAAKAYIDQDNTES